MDPFTGDVRALVGGRDYVNAPFNRAIDAKRQPGSAFKVFVYAAAVADSLTPSAMVADTALAIPLPNRTTYRPSNSDGEFLGPLTLRTALARSRNPVAIQLAMQPGNGLGVGARAPDGHRLGHRAVSVERHRCVRRAAARPRRGVRDRGQPRRAR